MQSSNYYLKKILANKTPTYDPSVLKSYRDNFISSSKYKTKDINGLLGKLADYKSVGDTAEFKNLYDEYKRQYENNANLAAAETVTASNALDGGYGNDYSQAVTDSMYNAHMAEQGSAVPALMEAAANAYNNNRNGIYSNISSLQNERALKQSGHENVYQLAMEAAQKQYTAKATASADELSNLETLYSKALSNETASRGGGGRSGSGYSSGSGSTSGSSQKSDYQLYVDAYNTAVKAVKGLGVAVTFMTPAEYARRTHADKNGNSVPNSMSDYGTYLQNAMNSAKKQYNKDIHSRRIGNSKK